MSYQVKVIKDNIGFENALEEVYKALGEAGLDGRRTDPPITVVLTSNGNFTDDTDTPLLDVQLFINAAPIEVASEIAQINK